MPVVIVVSYVVVVPLLVVFVLIEVVALVVIVHTLLELEMACLKIGFATPVCYNTGCSHS